MQMLLKFASDRLKSEKFQHFQAQIVIFEDFLKFFTETAIVGMVKNLWIHPSTI